MNINIFPNAWDLHYFQEIAATGNLSRAAERLGVGQPTLSLSLKRLEELLGTDLFVRRSRGLTLTPAGQRLLRNSNQLLANWASLVSETKKSTTEMIGHFSLGCHPSVAIYSLPEVLRQIYTRYAGIEIQLVHGLSRVVCEGVISGQIDFGIVVNPVPHPDLIIHKLATDEVCFWKSTKGLDDVLIYDAALTQSQNLLKKLNKKKVFTRVISSNNLEVIATLAGNGAGTAILPTRVVQAISPQLQKIPKLPTYLDSITFVYRYDLPKTASSSYIVDMLKALKI